MPTKKITKKPTARRRVDPPKAPDIQLGKRQNEDPDRHYVWANPNDPECGLGYYLELGYVQDMYVPGGVRTAGIQQREGEALTWRGLISVSISKERKAEIDQYGETGAGGQNYIDLIDSKINSPGGVDGFRSERGLQFQKETEEAESQVA